MLHGLKVPWCVPCASCGSGDGNPRIFLRLAASCTVLPWEGGVCRLCRVISASRRLQGPFQPFLCLFATSWERAGAVRWGQRPSRAVVHGGDKVNCLSLYWQEFIFTRE